MNKTKSPPKAKGVKLLTKAGKGKGTRAGKGHVKPYSPSSHRKVSTPSGTRVASVEGRIASARRAFSSDSEIATALGVDRSQLSRWKAGQSPDDMNRDKLVGLDATVELLSGFLSERTIHKWLMSPNAHLANRRPISVLRANRTSEVIAAIEAEKSGAFA
jgi:hypothetical protein